MLFLFFILLAVTPVRLGLFLRRAPDLQGYLLFRPGPVPFRFPFRFVPNSMGRRQLVFLPRRARSNPRPAPSAQVKQHLRALHTVLRADKARRLLRRFFRLNHLAVYARVSLSDAASTARLCGLLQGLSALTPPSLRGRTVFRVVPDFFAAQSLWQAECIISIPLGILFSIGGLAYVAFLREKRSARARNKEVPYGSSDR